MKEKSIELEAQVAGMNKKKKINTKVINMIDRYVAMEGLLRQMLIQFMLMLVLRRRKRVSRRCWQLFSKTRRRSSRLSRNLIGINLTLLRRLGLK